MRQHLRAAPGNAVEQPPRSPPQADQGVAAVRARRKHCVGALAQGPRGSAQIGRPERRAIAADQDHIRMLAERALECAMHAIAKIASTLGLKADLEALPVPNEKIMPHTGRAAQEHFVEPGGNRCLQRPHHKSGMQPRRALFAE